MLKSTCTCPFQYAEKRALEHKHKLDNTRTRPRGAVEHEHEHESTATSIRAARARTLENEHEVGRQPVRAVSRILNDMRNGHFLNLYMGLHGLGWLYVLGMPSRGYLPIFTTLNPHSTCHGPRLGPTLAPWCSGGLPACPSAESTRKDPRPGEKKMPMCKKHTHTHLHIL